MKIFDKNNNLLDNPDLEKGYLKEDKLFIQHHEAIEPVEEVYHYEYKIYSNGGKDRVKVIDTPAVEGVEAFNEYEDIYRYIEYTAEELEAIEAEKNKPALEERIAELEEALRLLLEGATE